MIGPIESFGCMECNDSGEFYVDGKPQVCVCVGETRPYQRLVSTVRSLVAAMQDDQGRGCVVCRNDPEYHEHGCPKAKVIQEAYDALGEPAPQLWASRWFNCSICGLKDCHPKSDPRTVCHGCDPGATEGREL